MTSSDLIAGTWWRRIGQGTFALLLLFGPWISQEQPLRFERPPKMRNQAGVIRRVGIEIEFGGLSGKRATELVQRRFGGTVHQEDPNAWSIADTRFGKFELKLDTRFGHPKFEPGDATAGLKSHLASIVGTAMALVVPHEIVTPPIPIDRLAEVEELVGSLRAAGAEGTEQSLFYAFGLHFNPEVPSFEPVALTAILKAFSLLSPWLWQEIDPDNTRQLLRFAEPYGESYVRRIADTTYWPDLGGLIDDYLDANPSRDRDLDALPLFAYLDERRVRARLPDEKIGPRPTFHYRLPDARISSKRWSLATEWNRWIAVERLADDRARLDDLCARYLARQRDRDGWANVVAGMALT